MKAAVLFITVFVVTGINGQAESEVVKPTPKPCCMPRKFSTNIMQMKSATKPEMDGVSAHWQSIRALRRRGIPVSMPQRPHMIPMHQRGPEVYMRTNVDYTLEKQAVTTYNYNPETKEKNKVAWVLFDYAMGKMYIATGEHEEKCQEMPLQQPMYPNCLEGMTFVGSSYLGPPSAKLVVNTWTAKNKIFNVTITVTENECIPVTQTQVGEFSGFHTDDIFMYENTVPDKVDKGAFDLPPSCKKNDLVFQPTV